MVSIEDPFDQQDWDGYRPFTAAVGEKVELGGLWWAEVCCLISDVNKRLGPKGSK